MIEFHELQFSDMPQVATIHAASWRISYRGILRDEYLDGDLLANRHALWSQRLAALSSQSFGVIARENGEALGFSYAVVGSDPKWGTLIDNLHVVPGRKGQGIGRGLLQAMASRIQQAAPQQGVYLWVYEDNLAARQFYASLGGVAQVRELSSVPGGGQAQEWLISWPSAQALLDTLTQPKTTAAHMGLTIGRLDPGEPDSVRLMDALSDTLAGITGASGRASFDPDDVRGARACFVLARDAAGRAVGCGAFRPLSDTVAEIKRMYAAPGTRGVGSAILAYLEAQALTLGYAEVWLETRRVNQRAVSFYEGRGYQCIANYGKYAGNPAAVCMAKPLNRSADASALSVLTKCLFKE